MSGMLGGALVAVDGAVEVCWSFTVIEASRANAASERGRASPHGPPNGQGAVAVRPWWRALSTPAAPSGYSWAGGPGASADVLPGAGRSAAYWMPCSRIVGH